MALKYFFTAMDLQSPHHRTPQIRYHHRHLKPAALISSFKGFTWIKHLGSLKRLGLSFYCM
jgi:hypothetical protein